MILEFVHGFLLFTTKIVPVTVWLLKINFLYNPLIIWVISLSFFVFILVFFLNKRKKIKINLQLLHEENLRITQQISNLKSDKHLLTEEKKKEIKNEITQTERNIRILDAALKSAKESAVRNSELLSDISHTLRTNLNDILGFSNLLENEFAQAEDIELYEYSRNIRSSGQSLLHLLNNMIDISRIESGSFQLHPKQCKINDILNELIKNFEPEASRKGLKIIYNPIDIPRLYTDIDTLKHILTNLLDNAVKFTEKGFIKISCEKQSEKIILSIKDTGMGIDKAYITDIFEPFEQIQPGFNKTSYKGTGLGLPLVKHMVGLLNGQISIQSEKTIGTTVTIALPFTLPVQNMVIHNQNTNKGHIQNRNIPELKKAINKILIIDGDPFNKLLIKKMIPSIQSITQVSNEQDVQKIFLEKKNWDVILLDIDFQKYDYGIELLKKYRNLFNELQKVPFIALLPVHDESKEKLCKDEGFAHTLIKPIAKENLFPILNEVLEMA